MQHKWLERTELLIKENGIKNLQKSHILVVGLGGVGSFATEFLVRAGIGKLT
ncbi:MAG TPA: tRNA threonylcarbamoyladenosine dehydratase, partial [Flavobacteriia bacterium]|nr:tRNA threonylcarbamoyladenosine dehydratase [Flavobacteriia bacterium]